MLSTLNEIIKINNNHIEDNMKKIKKYYNIEVTEELLKQFIGFAYNAMNYCNEKYNLYTKSEIENIYLFLSDQEISRYYNLIHACCYKDPKYKEFIQQFNHLTSTELLEAYKYICSVICDKIYEYQPNNCLESNNDEYIETPLDILEQIKQINVIKNNSLLCSYIYLNYKENIKITLEIIREKIKNELDDIQNGKCELLEMICIYQHKTFGLTNLYAQMYLSKLFEVDDLYKTNYEEHKKVLQIIEGYLLQQTAKPND